MIYVYVEMKKEGGRVVEGCEGMGGYGGREIEYKNMGRVGIVFEE